MHDWLIIDPFKNTRVPAPVHEFRGRDRYCLSDKRRCLRLAGGDHQTWHFPVITPPDPRRPLELFIEASSEIHDSHAYTRKFLNSLIALRLNDTEIFNGMIHWRSHEETASFWPTFRFPFDPTLLRPGENRIELFNRSSRDALGEFFDPQLLNEFPTEVAERKLCTIYLSHLRIVQGNELTTLPRLAGIPPSAIAGVPFLVELNSGDVRIEARVTTTENAQVIPLGAEFEFDAWRALYEITPLESGRPVRWTLESDSAGRWTGAVERVYSDHGPGEFIALPGAETTYWHALKPAVRDCFEQVNGNGVRIAIDDYLNNLHLIPLEKWIPLIQYLVRRRQFYALQRVRVPHYTRISHAELRQLADLGGRLFAGVSIVEPVLHLHRNANPSLDLAQKLKGYLDYFKKQMDECRLPGHRLVTFDSAGALCGHYYAAGLDCHISEIGPACNVLEESCARGAARVAGKPWGVACAMQWYCGQGAEYACDESRVRLTRQIMLSSYLAGARQILWEGGLFENIPVYNYILSEESWRDYGREFEHPTLERMRGCFRELLAFHQTHQLPQPTVRQAFIQGQNDLFNGTFSASTSAFGDFSIMRAWTLLKVFLPHFSFGRHGVDHGRPHRRWYSATPFGQVDVIAAESSAADFARYPLLVLAGWNTMTEPLYARLEEYVRQGGTLMVSLPHFCTDTRQQLEWKFLHDGDLHSLCGLRVRDLGGRIESVRFTGDYLAPAAAREVCLSPKNPLFFEDYDEQYPVFNQDITYFAGDIERHGAEVLAESQRGEPVILRHAIGRGQVILFNTWSHLGRGRLLNLAEGVLQSLAAQNPQRIQIDDPQQRISWFEYAESGYDRFYLLNTDWTVETAVPAKVTIGRDRMALTLFPGRPVQVASDGIAHLILEDPAIQVADWKKGPDGIARVRLIGPAEALRSSVRVCGDRSHIQTVFP
jgi:hypothetical protein